MAKFLIKIDRKSIKRNKDAGQRILREPTTSEAIITIRGVHKPLHNQFDNVNRISVQWEDAIHKREATYIAASSSDQWSEIVDYIRKNYKKDAVRLSIRQDYEEIHLMTPIPTFSYQYKNTKVQCYGCKAKFPHEDLKTDYDYYGDGSDYYMEDICPECGMEECCKIEFEKLTDEQLERLAK